MIIAKKYTDKLEKIISNINDSREYFKDNYKRYTEFRKFIFLTSLSQADKDLLETLQKPVLEFNMLEAYLSRILGEFYNQEPSFKSQPVDINQIDPQTMQVVEGICRNILNEANYYSSFQYDIFKKQMSGGFAVAKVFTDYQHEESLDQIIYLESIEPTLTGFDKKAKFSHKGDGDFCFEITPMYKEEAENYFNIKLDDVKFQRTNNKDADALGGFSWSYKNSKNEGIIMVGTYYEKVKKKAKLVQLTNGQVMLLDDYERKISQWNDEGYMEQPASIKGKPRDTTITNIDRYYVIENQVLDRDETDYKYLPLVFFDGASAMIQDNSNAITQVTRPYFYHAKDNQRLQNFAGQNLANELENMTQAKLMASLESVPDQYLDAYKDPQKANVIPYYDYNPKIPTQKLTPPQIVQRQPIPPQIAQAFEMAKGNNQAILGSYDASLGINDNQLSGKAIENGAMMSNAAVQPYITAHMQGLNQIAKICVDLIPKYYTTPRTVPIVLADGKRDFMEINTQNSPQMNFKEHALQIRIEAGPSFAVQKKMSLQQIIATAQAMPIFNEFFSNMPGALKILIDNFEIRNVEQLQQLAEDYVKMRQQQMQQAMQMQQQQQQKPQIDPNQVKMMDIQRKAKKDEMDYQTDVIQAQNENLKIQLEANQSHAHNIAQMAKAEAEEFNDKTELALKVKDMHHKHNKEIAEMNNYNQASN